MRIRLLILLMALTIQIVSAQNYTLHSASKGVTVETAGKSVKATKGMKLKATDNVVIPKGGSAEILNSLDNCIYKSVGTGRISVTGLMARAKESAGDKLAAVGAKLKLAKGEASSKKRVYSEKGMVYRSVDISKSEADGIVPQPHDLAIYIMSRLDRAASDSLPEGLMVEKNTDEADRQAIRVRNNLDYPVYVNILRLRPDNTIGISPLLNCDLNHWVSDNGSLSGDFTDKLTTDDKDIVIITAAPADISRTIEEVNAIVNDGNIKPEADDQLPVYVKVF